MVFASFPISFTCRAASESVCNRATAFPALLRVLAPRALRWDCVGLLLDLSHGCCNLRPHLSRQERPVEVGDWRKNVEAMSGMEGRKKMFDAAKSPTGQ